eukprot:Skav221275  [mRNA]  locus=scaffold2775:48100:54209:+ [translate_table: standard]
MTYCLEPSSNDWPWHEASLPWLQLPWYDPQDVALEIAIYYDGAYLRKEGLAGAGVLMFLLTQDGWKFGGATSEQLPATASGAYDAELQAALIALKVLHDQLKVCAFHHPEMPPPCCNLCFDNASVGWQSAGFWKSATSTPAVSSLRSLVRLVEQRYGVQVQHHHVPGHGGDPGNEAADVLAGAAARGSPIGTWSSFLQTMSRRQYALWAQWFWFLFQTTYNQWEGHFLRLPPRPCTLPSDVTLPAGLQGRAEELVEDTGLLRLRLATANVLSLKGDPNPDCAAQGLQGVTRQQYILQQMHDAGIQIFALQETRLRSRHHLRDSHYTLTHSIATDRGHFGMLLGFNRALPWGTAADGTPVYFTEEAYKIIVREPRLIIACVRLGDFCAVVIGVHAPHSGASLEEITAFWTRIDTLIPHRYASWGKIVLADANANVGAEPSTSVGPWQAGPLSDKTQGFTDFLARQHLFAPATFEEYHVGEGGTWRHPSGTFHRLDYVSVALQWPFRSCTSWVSSDIDISLSKEDHRVAVVEITLDWRPARPRKSATIKRDIADVDWYKLAAFTACPVAPDVDVHQHASLVQERLLATFAKPRVRRGPTPLKKSMSEETWALVQQKKYWRQQCFDGERAQRLLTLRACFAVLRQESYVGGLKEDFFTCCRALQKEQDLWVATARSHFGYYSRLVVKAMRRDDRAFFEALLGDAAECLHPTQAKKLWSVVRRSLPKFRDRRLHPDPHRIDGLDLELQPHFRDLEVGNEMMPEELQTLCMQRQDDACRVPTDFEPADLPSLVEIENVLRAVAPQKGTGYDEIPSDLAHCAPVQLASAYFPLFLKSTTWEVEPFSAKGGVLAPIPKVPNAVTAANYRGILLLPTFSKCFHALLRKQLISVVEHKRPPGQLGGFPRQEVGFGQQYVATVLRVMGAAGHSTGVLYVDLSTAFHKLVRELIVGVTDEQAAASVLHALADRDLPTHPLQRRLLLQPILERLGARPSLVRLLADIHADTWFRLKNDQHARLTRTARGTRPGSPLADIIFHLAMLDAMNDLQSWLASQPPLTCLQHEMDLVLHPIAWSDDLAIPVASKTAAGLAALAAFDDDDQAIARLSHADRSALEQQLQEVTHGWFDRFQARGCQVCDGDELQDLWLQCLGEVPADDQDAAGICFLEWGRNVLPEELAHLIDGEAEGLIDCAFADLANYMDATNRALRRDRLAQRLRHLRERADGDVPHRAGPEPPPSCAATRTGSAPGIGGDPVPRLYGQHAAWFDRLRAVKWDDLPAGSLVNEIPFYKQLTPRPKILICHLFSGRRRHGDFHYWMTEWGHRRGIDVVVLSADIAVSSHYGNLSPGAEAHAALEECYNLGAVGATLCGPPCETFSEARHNAPVAPDPADDLPRPRWPRPLRSRDRIAGLEHLTMREMRQLQTGSFFMFSMLLVMARHICTGGLFVMEHPGPPSQEERASAWSTAWALLLRAHPDAALHVLSQWQWGAESVKPTGFLTLRLPRFLASMLSRRSEQASFPKVEAIGVGDDGKFRTAALKEYSTDLCRVLSGAISDELDAALRRNQIKLIANIPDALQAWIGEAHTDATVIRSGTTFLPDYQGR